MKEVDNEWVENVPRDISYLGVIKESAGISSVWL